MKNSLLFLFEIKTLRKFSQHLYWCSLVVRSDPVLSHIMS